MFGQWDFFLSKGWKMGDDITFQMWKINPILYISPLYFHSKFPCSVPFTHLSFHFPFQVLLSNEGKLCVFRLYIYNKVRLFFLSRESTSDRAGGRIFNGIPAEQFSSILLYTAKTKWRKFETNIPRKGISGPQSQFPHSCVCERIIYSHDGSAFSAGENMWTDPGNI